MKKYSLWSRSSLVVFIVCALTISVSAGSIRTVTNTGDNVSTVGSLRYWVLNSAAGDTIVFSPDLVGPINVTNGILEIAKPLTIQGPGKDQLTVDGTNNGGHDVFQVDAGIRDVVISGMTVTAASSFNPISNKSGYLSVSGCNLSGCKGISFDATQGGSLTVTNSNLSNNYGDGIYCSGFGTETISVSISGCSLSNNLGSGLYIGMYSTNLYTTVQNCSISGNSSSGIWSTGTLVVKGSTISENGTSGYGAGGGIYGSGGSGSIKVINSTIWGNTASGGGGILNSTTLTLTNCTVSQNTSQDGGGIYNSGGVVTLNNTIIAYNSSGTGPDILGTVTAYYCIIGDPSGATISPLPNNHIGTHSTPLNPKIAWFGNTYGGPIMPDGSTMWTAPLLPGSPAINNGNNTLAADAGVTQDQRGVSRNGTVDIGACEGPLPSPTPSVHMVTNTGDNASTTGSLRYWILNAAAGDTITFSPDLVGPINVTNGILEIAKPLTIQGPGANQLTIDGTKNKNHDVFQIDAGIRDVQISGITVKAESNYDAISNESGYLGVTACTLSGCRGISFVATQGGSLTVTNSNLSNNYGDGIHCSSYGTETIPLSITGCSLSNNLGSGLYIGYTSTNLYTTVQNCSISGNSSSGIWSTGTLVVKGSTISENGTSGYGAGGGIYGSGGSGSIKVINSTIWGNTASGGGGILNSTTLTLTNCTVSHNTSTNGGGIYNSGGVVTLNNTIIAYNSSGTGPDIFGTIDAYYCLIGDPAGATIPTSPANHNLIGSHATPLDPGLVILGDTYGGLTMPDGSRMSIAPLLTDSPAKDAGNNGLALDDSVTTDQRGYPRPAHVIVDIGAYEYQPIVTSISPTSGPASGGNTVIITGIDLAGATAVNFGTTPVANGSFQVDASYTHITATAPAGSIGPPVHVTVTTPSGTSASTSADYYTYIATHAVTFVEGTNGTITGTKAQTVNHGSDCSPVTASQNQNYHFVNWTGTNGFVTTTDNPLTVKNVTIDMTITANFAHDTGTLMIATGGGGSTNPSPGASTINTNTATSISATASTGYHFVNWTKSGSVSVADETLISTTATLTGSAGCSGTVTANFAINNVQILTDVDTVNVPEGSTNTFQVKLSMQPPVSKTVTVSRFSGDTDITVSAGSPLTFTTSNWNNYQSVTLAAAEDADTVNGSAVIRCMSSGMADKDVTATEMDNDTTLTVVNDGNGTTTPSGATVVTKSAATAISATAGAGYHFVNWTFTSGSADFGNAASISTTATITAPATIRANFTVNSLAIVTDVDAVNVPEGSTNTFQVKLSMQPPASKTVTVSRFSGDTDITVSAGSPLTFTTSNWDTYQTVTLAAAQDTDTANGSAVIRCTSSGMADKDVTATEMDNDTTLTVVNDGNGTTTPSGATVVTKSAATAISATASVGYHFVNWTFTSGSADFGNAASASTTATITAPATIRANFTVNSLAILTDVDTVNVPEGSTNSFQVKLSAQPPASKTVTVSRFSGDTDITVSAGSPLTFTTSNWDTYQTVTLAAAQDTDTVNGTAVIRCSSSGMADKDVTATEVDNDTTLTVTNDGNGTTTPSGATVVTKSAATAISATASVGYHFVNWTATSGSAAFANENSANTTATITAPATIRANFTVNSLAILTDVDAVNVPEGSTNSFQVKLSAQPPVSKTVTVSRSSGDTDITVSAGSSPLTFTTSNWNTYQTVTLAAAQDTDTVNGSAVIRCSSSGMADKDVTATEVDNDTTLTVTNDGNGTTTSSGATVVTKSAATAISATASVGYHFVNWSVTSGSAAFANENSANTTATITAPATIRANFTVNSLAILTDVDTVNVPEGSTNSFHVKLSAQPPVSKTVTVSRASGDTDIMVSNGSSLTFTTSNWDTYQTVTLAAAQDADTANGSAVIRCSSSGMADKDVTATEVDNDTTLTVTNDGNGTTTSSGATVVTKSAATAISATASVGYHFVNWSVTSGSADLVNASSASTNVTITAPATIRANFAKNNYAVTFDLAGKGTRIGGGALSQEITFGSAATPPTVFANSGWVFIGWGKPFNPITDNLTVTAQWFGIADPGAQAAMVGVPFTLQLAVESEISPVKSVTVTGLPAGLKFDAKTMTITGVPTAAVSKSVTVTAKNDFKTPAILTFTITVEPLFAWAQGAFNGSCAVNNDSGTATMTVTSVGKITGKLSAGGKNYAFSAASFEQYDGYGTFWISTKINVDKVDKHLLLLLTCPPELESTTSCSEGWFANEPEGESAMVMYRSVWKDTGMATTLDPYIGYYTAVLPGCAEYGSGYLALTVDKAGTVKTTGKLSDGTALSLSGPLIIDINKRIFTVIYTSPTTYKGGCLFGLAEFVKQDGGEHVFLRLVDWVPFRWENRNPLATSEYVGEGFIRDLGLTGGWYDKVGNLYDYYQNKTLTVVRDQGAADPELIVGVNRYPSVWWDFSGIGLETVRNSLGIITGLSAPKANLPVKVNGVWDYSAENTVGLTTGLNRATGIFKGSFKSWFDYGTTHTSRSIPYEGVLTPEREDKEDGIEGRGFFLWADKAQYLNLQGRAVTYPFNWSYDFLILGDGK